MSANGFNWRHWTEWNEDWYLERLEYIRKGHPKYGIPYNASTWRDKIRGMPSARLVTTGIHNHSKQYVVSRS
jgi:hypothetical protein